VKTIFYSRDLAANEKLNDMGDDMVFASNEILYFGQPVGVCVAESQSVAEAAARLVEIKYKDLPAIITIEEAIKADSKFSLKPLPDAIDIGDVDKAFEKAEYIAESSITLGGAEHYYMEPCCALAIPDERDELTIIATTQTQSNIQTSTAKILGLRSNQVKVMTKRLGGGFGGKQEFITYACSAALAAHKLNQPVKIVLDRNVDMLISGKRSPTFAKYKIGADKNGKILAMDWDIYANG